MAEIDVAAYKEAVFGNGQPPAHPPTPPPTNDPPASIVEPSTVKVDPPIVQSNDEDEIVDAEEYIAAQIKENLGVQTWEEAKTALSELAQLREAAKTPAEIKYANEQSKALHEAIAAGKTEEVYEILDTQKKIAGIEAMKPADSIKLHISLTHKDYKPIDIEDVFEEKYSYPEKPEQRLEESDKDFEIREEKWNAAKEKIDRRIERDAATAKSELQKLSAELKLPQIEKQAANTQINEEDEKLLQKEAKEASEYYSKLTPKDVQMVFKFNDEASKLAFDILYEPDKESFDNAVEIAKDPQKFWMAYYEQDGSPKRKEFFQDLHNGRNIQKIVSEAIVQAVTQERLRALRDQKQIGNGTQRNFVIQQPTEIEKLKQAVFGK